VRRLGSVAGFLPFSALRPVHGEHPGSKRKSHALLPEPAKRAAAVEAVLHLVDPKTAQCSVIAATVFTAIAIAVAIDTTTTNSLTTTTASPSHEEVRPKDRRLAAIARGAVGRHRANRLLDELAKRAPAAAANALRQYHLRMATARSRVRNGPARLEELGPVRYM